MGNNLFLNSSGYFYLFQYGGDINIASLLLCLQHVVSDFLPLIV